MQSVVSLVFAARLFTVYALFTPANRDVGMSITRCMQVAVLLPLARATASRSSIRPAAQLLSPAMSGLDPPPPGDNHRLDVRIRGYYPFPSGPSAHGPLGWLSKDIHQAIEVRCGTARLRADFMTAGGQSHPVWWDEAIKWHVLLGGTIDGEVRLKRLGETDGVPSAKLERFCSWAAAYDPRMQLYTKNCRVFCCRARREAERLNAEDEPEGASKSMRAWMCDMRLIVGLLGAGALPAAYPLGTLALCWPVLAACESL